MRRSSICLAAILHLFIGILNDIFCNDLFMFHVTFIGSSNTDSAQGPGIEAVGPRGKII